MAGAGVVVAFLTSDKKQRAPELAPRDNLTDLRSKLRASGNQKAACDQILSSGWPSYRTLRGALDNTTSLATQIPNGDAYGYSPSTDPSYTRNSEW